MAQKLIRKSFQKSFPFTSEIIECRLVEQIFGLNEAIFFRINNNLCLSKQYWSRFEILSIKNDFYYYRLLQRWHICLLALFNFMFCTILTAGAFLLLCIFKNVHHLFTPIDYLFGWIFFRHCKISNWIKSFSLFGLDICCS